MKRRTVDQIAKTQYAAFSSLMLCLVDNRKGFETEPALVALYDIRPGNELGLFYSFTDTVGWATGRASGPSCRPTNSVRALKTEMFNSAFTLAYC